MYVQYQALGVILTILQIMLAPLAIGLVVGLANGSARRTIIAAAITASVMVFVGVALIDAITRLRGQIAFYQSPLYSQPGALAVSLGALVLSAGLSLSFAAVILGLRETARLRRWGWFWAFLLTQIAAAIGTTLFYLAFVSYMFSVPLVERLYRGDPAISVPYFLLTSLLLIAVPLAALLFAIIGVPRVEPPLSAAPARPAPMPPTAPPNTPYQPYPQYPPQQ
jgi:hypothetical protein